MLESVPYFMMSYGDVVALLHQIKEKFNWENFDDSNIRSHSNPLSC